MGNLTQPKGDIIINYDIKGVCSSLEQPKASFYIFWFMVVGHFCHFIKYSDQLGLQRDTRVGFGLNWGWVVGGLGLGLGWD